MKLDAAQAAKIIQAIDLRNPVGREVWKTMLHPEVDGTLTDVVNRLIAEKNEYIGELLTIQVAKRMSK